MHSKVHCRDFALFSSLLCARFLGLCVVISSRYVYPTGGCDPDFPTPTFCLR